MKQDLRKLIINAAILIAGFLIIDILVGFIGELALKKLPDFGNRLCQINYRLNRVKTDVVIVGSSRAKNHYHTEILADSVNRYLSTDHTFYNAGIGGHFVDGNACTIESIVKRYKPKLIIFEVCTKEVIAADWQKRMRKYEPFYKSNSTVKDFLDRMGWKERIIVRMNMYRFNSNAVMLIDNILHHRKENDGYSPLYKTMTNPSPEKEEIKFDNIEWCDFSINSFNRMILLCKNQNINLVIATSPRYYPNDDNKLIHSICNKYNVPYIDEYNTEYFNNHSELFYDRNHLNNDGATIYTQIFFEKIKPYLNGF